MTACLLAVAALAAPPADGRRVLVLIAADRSDPRMREMVDRDVDTFKRLLAENLPPAAVAVTELTGPALTADAVVGHYRTLDVRPADALVFYYTGHGAFRTGDVHTLEFQVRAGPDGAAVPSDQALTRTELKRAMLAKKAALTVLLTDCCSDYLNAPPPDPPRARAREAPPPLTQPTAAGRALFLQARGEVDVTAAARGQTAVCDSAVGSYFTVALRRAARPEAVGWAEYVEAVKAETRKVMAEEARRPGMEDVARSVREKTVQTPLAFVVKTTQPAADRPAYAAVALDNPTAAPVVVQVRWGTAGDWSKPFPVAADRYALKLLAVPAGLASEVVLQVRVGDEVKDLPAKVGVPAGPPGVADAAVYELPACKPVAKAAGKARALLPDDPAP